MIEKLKTFFREESDPDDQLKKIRDYNIDDQGIVHVVKPKEEIAQKEQARKNTASDGSSTEEVEDPVKEEEVCTKKVKDWEIHHLDRIYIKLFLNKKEKI